MHQEVRAIFRFGARAGEDGEARDCVRHEQRAPGLCHRGRHGAIGGSEVDIFRGCMREIRTRYVRVKKCR